MELSTVNIYGYAETVKDFVIAYQDYFILGIILTIGIVIVIHTLRKLFNKSVPNKEDTTVTADTIKNNTVNNVYNFN